MIHKELLPDGQQVKVTFTLPSSIWAERVNLVGDFNDWDTTRHEMRQGRSDGCWRTVLFLGVGSKYEFRYLVDGRDWHNDWHADEYAPNRYGTENSVLIT